MSSVRRVRHNTCEERDALGGTQVAKGGNWKAGGAMSQANGGWRKACGVSRDPLGVRCAVREVCEVREVHEAQGGRREVRSCEA